MSEMFQFSQPQSKYIIMITISILATFTIGEIKEVNVIEGKDIELFFTYRCNVSEVTLRHSYRAPFYDSANPGSMSLPENQKLIVNEEEGECKIQLLFTPALRSDKGGYILTVYARGRILEDTGMLLRVDYPPGTASCEWTGEDIADDWVSLKCIAQAGSLSGEIVCYQNGIKVPHLGNPTADGVILQQTLWARNSQPVFCCAIVTGSPIHRCDCKDYKWDSSRNYTNPCPVTTPQAPQHDSTSLKTSVQITKQPNTKNPNSYFVFHIVYLIGIGILGVVIIGLIIALILSYRRASKLMEQVKRKSETPRDGYWAVPVHEI